MFRDDSQIREVADALCRRAGVPEWWGAGDVGAAVEWLESGWDRNSQRALVGVAFAVWNQHGDVPLSALVSLDSSNLSAVGRLLTAVAEGAVAVDRWLELERAGADGPADAPPPGVLPFPDR